ncbi:MAG: hypothetical protein SGILL_010180 [Bacillariaceae sp.]
MCHSQAYPKSFSCISRGSALMKASNAEKTSVATIQEETSNEDSVCLSMPLVLKKQVSFASTCSVRPTISRSNITKQEKADSWYSSEEFQTIQMKSLQLVQMVESGKNLKGKRYCVRGLEGFTEDGYKTKKMNRVAASMIVIDTQDSQLFETGNVNYDLIAGAYAQLTSSSQNWAGVVGRRDWKVAMSCYDGSSVSNQEASSTKDIFPDASAFASPIKTLRSGGFRAARNQANAKAA